MEVDEGSGLLFLLGVMLGDLHVEGGFKLKMSSKEIFASCGMIGVLPDVNNNPLVDST